MTDYCAALKVILFPSQSNLNERQIERIDTSLLKLHEIQREKQTKLTELKTNLKLLQDKSNKIDSGGLPRNVLIENTKKRMKTLLVHTKSLQQNINFFEQCKFNLENSQMTAEMADQIRGLKQQLVGAGRINTDELNDNVDTIAEINDDLQEANFMMTDTMSNAWNSDMSEADEMLDEFLADSDYEDSDIEEEMVSESRVKPMVNAANSLVKEEEKNEEQPKHFTTMILPPIPVDLKDDGGATDIKNKPKIIHDF